MLSPAFDVTHAFSPAGEWTRHHQMSVNGWFDRITLADLYAVADTPAVPGFRQVTDNVISTVRRGSTSPNRPAWTAKPSGTLHDQMTEHSLA